MKSLKQLSKRSVPLMIRMKNKAVTELLQIGSSLLKNSDSAKLDARLLLAACLRYDKTQLITHHQLQVPNNIVNSYYFLIGQRANNIPLAYLLKSKEFYGLDFNISPKVLVPRPETETLIDLALKYIQSNKEHLEIIDLGTGSGCIAISLMFTLLNIHRENIRIDAIDNSTAALKTARINKALILGRDNQQIKIFKLDYLKKELPGYYDLILANPPYLNLMEYKHIKSTPVSFEPKNALYGSKDGLKYYKRINALLLKHLKPKGIAIIEIGQQSKKQIKAIYNKSFQIKYQNDLSGFERFLIISHQ